MWSLWGMNQLSWVLSVYNPTDWNWRLLQKDSVLLKAKYLGADPGKGNERAWEGLGVGVEDTPKRMKRRNQKKKSLY